MNLTRMLTTRLTRFWLWSVLTLLFVGMAFAAAGYWRFVSQQQLLQVQVLQQQLQHQYQDNQLQDADPWLPSMLALTDVVELRLWQGRKLLQQYRGPIVESSRYSMRFTVDAAHNIDVELLLRSPFHHYYPQMGDWVVMLLSLLTLVVVLRLGYHWYSQQLDGMETVAERCRLILQGHYSRARNLSSASRPRFINRALSKLLDELADARKERARFDDFIRTNTFLDHDTHIGNRLLLDNRLNALSNAHGMMAHGVLLLLEFEELEQLNGDGQMVDYLNLNVAHISRLLHSQANSVFARRSYNQLAIVVTQISLAEAEQLAAKVMKLCSSLLPREMGNRNNSCHLGAAYFKLGDNQQQLLEEAEMALRAAQIQGINTWFMYDKGAVDAEFARGSVRWRSFLELALEQRRFVAFTQPVVDVDGNLHHQEVFTRAKEPNGNLVRATLFLPMAVKCGLIAKIERQTIERVVFDLLPKANADAVFSINLSEDSLLNAEFMRWLRTLLLEYRDLAPRLIFEIDEAVASGAPAALAPKLRLIRKMGARLCVDHVGQQVISSQYIVEGGFTLVKLHRSLIKQIHLRTENQLFIRSLLGGLHKTDIEIMAEGVEQLEEWQTLRVLGVSAAQGPWFGDPEPA
ncbi:RNase E specificity factor CsrD [Shewanella yunxiaonensis]|uniref:RNase E specificity factor CsrD n=1 Tax=Shewanella yunxiaonensis TaxID=2829809 RepID=A0ABX7YTZ3_9GAMM|nr:MULTISPECIES: RNase E specificity factor CsrD [Shewanella]MDF0535220.1 RNase E specificity factor CsrD [Shewanella sp. A32]QUN05591.1 RNase E specificity factor CsrD [Shewanella yunxiaonensis]